jgi:hypothetical protein
VYRDLTGLNQMATANVLPENHVMSVNSLLQSLYWLETILKEAFIKTAEYHKTVPDIYYDCQANASESDDKFKQLRIMTEKYPVEDESGTENYLSTPIGVHETGLNLLSDLQYMWLLARNIELHTQILLQSATALNDPLLENTCLKIDSITARQSEWLLTRITREFSLLLPV